MPASPLHQGTGLRHGAATAATAGCVSPVWMVTGTRNVTSYSRQRNNSLFLILASHSDQLHSVTKPKHPEPSFFFFFYQNVIYSHRAILTARFSGTKPAGAQEHSSVQLSIENRLQAKIHKDSQWDINFLSLKYCFSFQGVKQRLSLTSSQIIRDLLKATQERV